MSDKFGWLTRPLADRAIRKIINDGIPPRRQSTKFDLVTTENVSLPPKLVISEAAKLGAIDFDENDFTGGRETNTTLGNLGFRIRERATGNFIERSDSPEADDAFPSASQFVPESNRPEEIVVAALKVLGGVGHVREISAQCRALGFAQPEPSVRRSLQQFSSDAVWTKARKPKGARDFFYSVDGVASSTGFWGLRGFLSSAPFAYPIGGLLRQHTSLLSRAETALDRMKGIAVERGRVVAIQVTFSPDFEYPNVLLSDGRIRLVGEGRLQSQPQNTANRGMLAAIESQIDIPVFQSVGPKDAKRYAYLGLYRVLDGERHVLRFGSRQNSTDAFVFTLAPTQSALEAGRGLLESWANRYPNGNSERGGYENPVIRKIAGAPPNSSNRPPQHSDPEARRQALERRNTSHHALLKAFEKRAEAMGLVCRCDQYADALCGGDIFEMKSLEDDEVAQVRAAIGQLYHYMFIHRSVVGYQNPTLYAVFDRPIRNDLRDFLVLKARIGVIWLRGQSFDADPKTKAALPWLFR